MLIRRIALVLTLALGGTQAANAQSATGMELHKWCSNPKASDLEELYCAVYLRGFLDGFLEDTAQNALCLPMGVVTLRQFKLIINKFMREHPEELHESAPTIIARALNIAYACKRS
jgi:hypothetical protein